MRQSFTKIIKTLAGAGALVLIFAAFAWAEGAGAAEEGPTVMDWVWRLLSFGVIVALILYIWNKVAVGGTLMKDLPKKRIEAVEAALAEAKAAREEALKRLADVQARLKDKDAEMRSLLDVAEENGRKEKAELLAEAERLSQDIVASAKENVDAELLKAKEALRREAAMLALELAEKVLKENVSREDQARMFEEYIAKVGNR